MFPQSHCLVIGLVLLTFLNQTQPARVLYFLQSPQTTTQQTDKQSQSQQKPQPASSQGDTKPSTTDVLKKYPYVPPPAVDEIQKGAQTPPDRNQSNFGKKISGEVNIYYDRLIKQGDVTTVEGNVNVTFGTYRIQSDRVIYDDRTKQITAEGNVVFDADVMARVTADRADINSETRLGVFYNATGFTNRTREGQSLYFTAARIEKTGESTYVLYDTKVTSCQNAIPTWSFSSKRTTIKVNDRAYLSGAAFRLKNFAILPIPYASIPINERQRKSGFMIPTTGSSTLKGRTLSIPYYQTLGSSADIIFRGDIYTARALGLGYEFRLRTDDRSWLRLGGLIVKDQLFGYNGPNQGGSSFYAYGAQYLPHGFVAVADANITSSLTFRQVFSQDYEEITNPEERSTFYVNNNFNGYSFNLLGEARTTTIQVGDNPAFTPAINVRSLPSIQFSSQSRPIWNDANHKWPFYFSFDSSASALERNEQVNDVTIFETPSAVQRLDFFPKVTVPLPSFGGFAITPSIGFRTTFYSDSIDPTAPVFDPVHFALTGDDPRLNSSSPQFDPSVTLFNPLAHPRVVPNDLVRTYSELAIDLRPPVIGKTYRKPDGSRKFTHVIEPYITYRRIDGLSNFAQVPRFDEVDTVARTSQLEYSIVNRFFVNRTNTSTNDTPQPQEVLSIKVSQYYFFDPTFGGALIAGQRNQFYPIDTLTAFSSTAFPHHFSPINVQARVRPLSSMFADLRFDYDTNTRQIRDVAFTGGFNTDRFTIEQTWYYVRRQFLPDGTVVPGTFSGNQYRATLIYGNRNHGWYGGTTVNINFLKQQASNQTALPTLLRSSTFIGYMGDCCGIELGYQTFDAGLRVENRFSFSFTLAGIGSIGTRNRIGERGVDSEGFERDRLSSYNADRY